MCVPYKILGSQPSIYLATYLSKKRLINWLNIVVRTEKTEYHKRANIPHAFQKVLFSKPSINQGLSLWLLRVTFLEGEQNTVAQVQGTKVC